MAKNKLDYNAIAQTIISNVGGKENVISVRHCITRVRFRLKDESKADDNAIRNSEGVISVVHGGGEYMVVIGSAVADVYDAVVSQLGVKPEAPSDEGTKEKVNPVMKVLNTVVGAVGPCLNLICAGGIVKGILTILETCNILQSGGGMDTLYTAVGDAIFYFLPIFLGYNLAKQLKGDPFLGALIGAILCYPSINGVDLTIFGRVYNYTYTSSFLPVIAVVAVAVPLAARLKRVIPKIIAGFTVPVLTLMIIIPLGYMIIGPLVAALGSAVNQGISFLMNAVPLLAGIVFGAAYQVMVLFGIHAALTSFSFMSLLEGNPDYIMAICSLVCFAQIGVVLAICLKTKDQKLKSVAIPAFISGVFGVTEPAIYGVTLPRIKMFVISCIGGAVTGAIVMLTDSAMYSFTGLGFFALLGMINAEHSSLFWPAMACVIPFLISFAIAYVLYHDEPTANEDTGNNLTESSGETDTKPLEARFEIPAPVAGDIVPITEVPDETFSTGMLGHGFAIMPTEGKVYAPFDGTCTTMFETLHAIGLEADNGVSLLIHVGLETVSLNGKPFKAHVKTGDNVSKGQLLLEFDMDQIREAGCHVITPVLVTNEDEVGQARVENNVLVIGG